MEGIIFHAERQQPFTVWFRSQVIYFAYTMEEAERRLADEIARASERMAAPRPA